MNACDNGDSNKAKGSPNSQALRMKPNSQIDSLSKVALNQSSVDDKETSQSPSSSRSTGNDRSSSKRTPNRGNQTANSQNSANDNYSDDEDCLRKSVLPVAKFDSYDENVPPKSGEEYLRRVQ